MWFKAIILTICRNVLNRAYLTMKKFSIYTKTHNDNATQLTQSTFSGTSSVFLLLMNHRLFTHRAVMPNVAHSSRKPRTPIISWEALILQLSFLFSSGNSVCRNHKSVLPDYCGNYLLCLQRRRETYLWKTIQNGYSYYQQKLRRSCWFHF